jgi:pimeloyl-ACP methyl ester carboxylesterase
LEDERLGAVELTRRLALICTICAVLSAIVGCGDGDEPASQGIGAAGGEILTQDNQRVGEIPSGSHPRPIIVSAAVEAGGLTVRRLVEPGVNLGPMSIRLPVGPSGKDFVPSNSCPAGTTLSMPNCWSGVISPAFFGDSLGGAKHRLSGNELVTSLRQASLRIEYGSQLTSSEPQGPLPGRVPVLFVHGYILGGGFGGGDGTWQSFPTQIRNLSLASGATPFVPFEFRWQTDASFIAVASDLSQAISEIHSKTGSRVHIVAHSFGGLLVRALLQEISDATKGAPWSVRDKVMSVTTIGTPHSGILRSSKTVEGVSLPAGWNPVAGDLSAQCFQISCYQAGLAPFVGLVDFVRTDLSRDASRDPPPPGYVTARLRAGLGLTSVAAGSEFPFLALIGQSIRLAVLAADFQFQDGDGLISYRGQRFMHDDLEERPKVLFEAHTDQGFVVTERVLGFGVKEAAFVGDSVSSVLTRSIYSAAREQGYWHAGEIRDLGAVPGQGPGALEAMVTESDAPNGCIEPCHDTWKNVRELLLSLHGGIASSNFPSSTGQLPRITSVVVVPGAPIPVVQGSPLHVSISGQNLAPDLKLSLPGCAAWLNITGGPSDRLYQCFPTEVGANLPGQIQSSTGVLLATFSVTVVRGAENQTPVPQLAIPSGVLVVGQPITLNPAGSADNDGSIVRWDWNFGDGLVHTHVGPETLPINHVYSTQGNFTVSLTVTDDRGATGTTSKLLAVSSPQPLGLTQLLMTATPDPVRPGQLVQYALTVTNRDTQSHQFIVNALVPAHSTVPANSLGQGGSCVGSTSAFSCPAGGTVRWTTTILGSGQSVTLLFTTMLDAANPPPNGTLLRSTATATPTGDGSPATAAIDVVVAP